MKGSVSMVIGVLVVAVAFVLAADEEPATTPAKNMTYGMCVSEQAAIKNTCYSTVKEDLATCKAQAVAKDATKQCSQAYKKDKKGCKTAFKDAKKECAKIKHNFLETIESAFK